jgi:hypothetical protein
MLGAMAAQSATVSALIGVGSAASPAALHSQPSPDFSESVPSHLAFRSSSSWDGSSQGTSKAGSPVDQTLIIVPGSMHNPFPQPSNFQSQSFFQTALISELQQAAAARAPPPGDSHLIAAASIYTRPPEGLANHAVTHAYSEADCYADMMRRIATAESELTCKAIECVKLDRAGGLPLDKLLPTSETIISRLQSTCQYDAILHLYQCKCQTVDTLLCGQGRSVWTGTERGSEREGEGSKDGASRRKRDSDIIYIYIYIPASQAAVEISQDLQQLLGAAVLVALPCKLLRRHCRPTTNSSGRDSRFRN